MSVFDAVFASSLSSRLRYLHVFAVFAMKEMKWFSYHVKGCHASVFTVVFAVFAIVASSLSLRGFHIISRVVMSVFTAVFALPQPASHVTHS